MKMWFFLLFHHVMTLPAPAPQTSRTTRGPVERKCAVLNNFPDTTFSELEWSWQRRPAEMDRWLFQEQPDFAKQGQYRGSRVPDSERSAFPGKLLTRCFTGALLLQDPSLTGRCFQLSPCSVLCRTPVLQWDGNTLQCFALHPKNLWGKHSLKRRKTNPLFIFLRVTTVCQHLPVETTPSFHKTIEL